MVGRERLREVDSNIKYKRDYSIDLLKSIAIIGVIVIHTCSYNYEIASPNWTFSVSGEVWQEPVYPYFLCAVEPCFYYRTVIFPPGNYLVNHSLE